LLDLARRASARVSVRVAVVALAASALLVACTPLNSQEQYLFVSTNDLRKANGLATISEYEPLTAKARWWAETLASEGRLAHEDLHQLGVKWTMAGENVGRGGSIEDIVRMLQASSSHRATMLEPGYQLTGVGTARAKDGTVYAVQLFIRM
jgi:uncharacterized protein YkwD